MRILKTRQNERSTYFYPINVADEKGGYRTEHITIFPGENEVTNVDINALHSLGDRYVYYNTKNLRPERTDKEKVPMERWRNKYIEKITLERGDVPTNDEVEDAIETKFPFIMSFFSHEAGSKLCLLLAHVFEKGGIFYENQV